MGRWLDRLFIRSKDQRRTRQVERDDAQRDADAQAQQRERQAHYRDVTHTDERGRDMGER